MVTYTLHYKGADGQDLPYETYSRSSALKGALVYHVQVTWTPTTVSDIYKESRIGPFWAGRLWHTCKVQGKTGFAEAIRFWKDVVLSM